MTDKPRHIRIIEYGTKPADQFTHNPANPRRHPQKQRDAVAGSLDTLGWIAPIVENQRTGYVIDGHERLWHALQTGEDVPYVMVDLSPEEEAQALATFDWITYLAEYDRDVLDGLLRDVQSDNAHIQQLIGQMASDNNMYETLTSMNDDGRYDELLNNPADDFYTRKVEPPIYEPTGAKPSVNDLYDDTRTNQLIASIEACGDLPPDVRQFLTIAAQRHTVLNFTNIAEFYAHADKNVQRLMEDSALVIIDFDQAIELGFVNLTQKIAELERGIKSHDD